MAKFEKGNPGGPGRPRGSRNAVNLLLDQLAVEGAETVVRKMVEVAAEGDQAAARLVLNRIWTAPKGRPMEIELPEIRTPADLVAAHAVVVTAIADGTITPQDGAALSAVLETHRRAFELLQPQSAGTPKTAETAPPQLLFEAQVPSPPREQARPSASAPSVPEPVSTAPSVCAVPEVSRASVAPQPKAEIVEHLAPPRVPATPKPKTAPSLLGANREWTWEEINHFNPGTIRPGHR